MMWLPSVKNGLVNAAQLLKIEIIPLGAKFQVVGKTVTGGNYITLIEGDESRCNKYMRHLFRELSVNSTLCKIVKKADPGGLVARLDEQEPPCAHCDVGCSVCLVGGGAK